jgi:hypothetical protein
MNKGFNLKDITEPKDGLIVYMNAYWLCVDGDPKKALFYHDAPQCNRDKRIQEWMLKEGQYAGRTDLEITHVGIAYAPNRY